MDHVSRLIGIAAAALLIAQPSSAAEPSCTLWSLSDPAKALGAYGEPWQGTDRQSLCQQNADADLAQDDASPGYPSNRQFRIQPGSVNGSYSSNQCRYILETKLSTESTWIVHRTATTTFTNLGATECPVEECDGTITGEQFIKQHAYGASLGETACHGPSNCKVSKGSMEGCVAATCLTVYTGTDETCESTHPDAGTVSDESEGEVCIESGGLEFCKGPNAPGSCGFVNDEYVCIKTEADSDKCFEHTDGSMLCADGTPTPPAPDSGTPGVPATPTTTMTVSTGTSTTTTTYNYYNTTTVGNSSRPAGGSAGGEGEGEGGGTCEGDDCGEGEGSVSGGVTCDTAPSCSGDALECRTILEQWRTRCIEPLGEGDLSAAMGYSASEGVGTSEFNASSSIDTELIQGGSMECPAAPTINFGWPLDTSIELDIVTWFCQLADRIRPLVLIASYLSAIMILLRGLKE